MSSQVKLRLAFQLASNEEIVRRRTPLTFQSRDSVDRVYQTVSGQLGGPPLWPREFGARLASGPAMVQLLFSDSGGSEWTLAPPEVVLRDLPREPGDPVDLLFRIVPQDEDQWVLQGGPCRADGEPPGSWSWPGGPRGPVEVGGAGRSWTGRAIGLQAGRAVARRGGGGRRQQLGLSIEVEPPLPAEHPFAFEIFELSSSSGPSPSRGEELLPSDHARRLPTPAASAGPAGAGGEPAYIRPGPPSAAPRHPARPPEPVPVGPIAAAAAAPHPHLQRSMHLVDADLWEDSEGASGDGRLSGRAGGGGSSRATAGLDPSTGSAPSSAGPPPPPPPRGGEVPAAGEDDAGDDDDLVFPGTRSPRLPGHGVNTGSTLDAEALFALVTRNDISGVRSLIDSAADVNAHTAAGSHVLFRAVMKARESDMVRLLLQARADPRRSDDKGNQVMHFWARATAAKNHLVDIGRALLLAGADANAQRASDGMSPLHHVVVGHNSRRGWLDFHKALLLVRHGANIHVRTDSGQTPADLVAPDGRAATRKLIFILRGGLHELPGQQADRLVLAALQVGCEQPSCPWCL